MTKALDEVFRRASELSEARQDDLAAAIQAEIEADDEWTDLLSSSPDPLGNLADGALSEYRTDRTEPLDPDKL
ncbi:MAG TPA: hypothetical protein VGK94_00630 [Candidatus Polarisedimenticolia bacterium]|jgi:hypothetical protein